MNQLDDLGEGDNNAPALPTIARILGRSIANGSISDEFIAVVSNTDRSATDTMVMQNANLQQASNIWM